MDHASLTQLPTNEVLAVFAESLEELRKRNIVRSSNNPVGDFAETVAAKALGLTLAKNSKLGYDGIDPFGIRYQIKSRRLTTSNKSRQLSDIRNLASRPFDLLVGILFDARFEVIRACSIPIDTITPIARYYDYVKAHRLILDDKIWRVENVEDITDRIIIAAREVVGTTST